MRYFPDCLKRVAVLIPVYFGPEEDPGLIRRVLENTFRDQKLASSKENLLAVVDSGSEAEELFRSAAPDSPLHGVNLHVLARNRCKAGAVQEGLKALLEKSTADYFVTRDCDGDHFVEDLPRLLRFSLHSSELTGNSIVCVMGSRTSLAKPMGWIRQEWELLTNDFLTGVLSLKLAEKGMVLDQRFWNGVPPDIQSGYRLYSRRAAEIAASGLDALPEDRHILKFACEFEPFLDISMRGGIFCQVNRLTLVEQPVSSYSNTDYAGDYGAYLLHAVRKFELDPDIALLVFDNALARRSLFFTDYRSELMRCRDFIKGDAAPPFQAPFV